MDEGWNKSRTDVKRENELVCNISVMGFLYVNWGRRGRGRERGNCLRKVLGLH